MYIKTKNGVYKISNILKNGDLLIKGKFHINKEVADECFKSENLKDLCDGFYIDIEFNVEHLSNCEYAFHHFEMFAKTMKSFRTNNKVMVKKLNGGYGYIRTDKCLLYVAKMNEKGELELI